MRIVAYVIYYSEVLCEYAKKKKKKNLGGSEKSEVWNVGSLIVALSQPAFMSHLQTLERIINLYSSALCPLWLNP